MLPQYLFIGWYLTTVVVTKFQFGRFFYRVSTVQLDGWEGKVWFHPGSCHQQLQRCSPPRLSRNCPPTPSMPPHWTPLHFECSLNSPVCSALLLPISTLLPVLTITMIPSNRLRDTQRTLGQKQYRTDSVGDPTTWGWCIGCSLLDLPPI